ncbi:MAG: hypothetical protein ACTSVC_08295 [Promethearchaeota archaeon]
MKRYHNIRFIIFLVIFSMNILVGIPFMVKNSNGYTPTLQNQIDKGISSYQVGKGSYSSGSISDLDTKNDGMFLNFSSRSQQSHQNLTQSNGYLASGDQKNDRSYVNVQDGSYHTIYDNGSINYNTSVIYPSSRSIANGSADPFDPNNLKQIDSTSENITPASQLIPVRYQNSTFSENVLVGHNSDPGTFTPEDDEVYQEANIGHSYSEQKFNLTNSNQEEISQGSAVGAFNLTWSNSSDDEYRQILESPLPPGHINYTPSTYQCNWGYSTGVSNIFTWDGSINILNETIIRTYNPNPPHFESNRTRVYIVYNINLPNEHVASANLTIRFKKAAIKGVNDGLVVHWGVSSMDWNDTETGGTILGTMTSSTTGHWEIYSWNVTSQVNSLIDGGQYYIYIGLRDDDDESNYHGEVPADSWDIDYLGICTEQFSNYSVETIYTFNSSNTDFNKFDYYNLTVEAHSSLNTTLANYSIQYRINSQSGYGTWFNLESTPNDNYIDSTIDKVFKTNLTISASTTSVQVRIKSLSSSINKYQHSLYIDQLVIWGHNETTVVYSVDVIYNTSVPTNSIKMSFNFTGWISDFSSERINISFYNFQYNKWTSFPLYYGDLPYQQNPSTYFRYVAGYPRATFWSCWIGDAVYSVNQYIESGTGQVKIRFTSTRTAPEQNNYTLTAQQDNIRLFTINYYVNEPRYYHNVTYSFNITEDQSKISEFNLSDYTSANETTSVFLYNWDTSTWENITATFGAYSTSFSMHTLNLTTGEFEKYINDTNGLVYIRYYTYSFTPQFNLQIDLLNIKITYEKSRDYLFQYIYTYHTTIDSQFYLNFDINMVGTGCAEATIHVQIYNFGSSSWEPLFNVAGTSTFNLHNNTLGSDITNYFNSTGDMNISVYYMENDVVHLQPTEINVDFINIDLCYINTALNDLEFELDTEINASDSVIGTWTFDNLIWSITLKTNVTTSAISCQIYNFNSHSWETFNGGVGQFNAGVSKTVIHNVTSDSNIRHYLNSTYYSRIKISLLSFTNLFQIDVDYAEMNISYYPKDVFPAIASSFTINNTRQTLDGKPLFTPGDIINFSAYWDEPIIEANLTRYNGANNITMMLDSQKENVGDLKWTVFLFKATEEGNFTFEIEVRDDDSNGGTHSSTKGISFVVDELTYISKSNNLTVPGLAELNQVIEFSATFDEPIQNAWFEAKFNTAYYENLSLTPSINGNSVTFIYICNKMFTNKTYRIWGFNGINYQSTPETNLTVISNQAPQPVLDLATDLQNQKVLLTWSPCHDNVKVTHYEIYRRINDTMDSTNYFDYYYTSTTMNSYNDTNVTEQNSYYYLVVAVDGANTKSSISNVVSIIPDLTPPALVGSIEFFVDGVLSEGKISIGQKITIQIQTSDDCVSVQLIVSNDLYVFNPVEMEKKSGTTFWTYQLDTATFNFGEAMPPGTFDLTFIMTDKNGNKNSLSDENYIIHNAITIVKPASSNMVYIIIGAAVGAIAVIGIVIAKSRGGREVEEEIVPKAATRKRQIYSGASSLGKMSGSAADALLEMRRKKKSAKKVVSKTTQRSSAYSAKPKKPLTTITPEAKSFQKLPASVQMKLAEQKIDVNKRVNFLDSKLNSLDSQLAILKAILSQIKDEDECPICHKPVAKDWPFCPYCKIKDQEDELNLKRSLLSFNNAKSVCPKCGLILDPSWPTCPRCFAEEHKK